MPIITKKVATKYAKILNLNTDVVPIDVWQYAMNVELEHGTKTSPLTNVTRDNVLLTAKIALAHILEFPDYYQRLKKMETQAERYWKQKKKYPLLK